MAEKKATFHEQVAAKLIEQLKEGTAPWQKPWDGIETSPINGITGKRYRGINNLWLQAQNKSDPRWMTYKQAASIGAQVRKGEKGTVVEYWKFTESVVKTDEKGREILDEKGQPVREEAQLERPRVFHAVVFNGTQIDGLPPVQQMGFKWDPNEMAEKILANSGAKIEHKAGNNAFYNPIRDDITLPMRDQFDSAEKYYGVALHELGHWTGHETRLNRDLGHPFGSEAYAREELRAEIASLMLSQEIGVDFDPGNHASYVKSWVSILEDEPMEIFRAAADAERIQSYVMNLSQIQEVEQVAEVKTVQDEIDQPVNTLQQAAPVADDAVKVVAEQVTYVQIPFADKEKAKALGAKWDGREKSWYIPPGVNQEPFRQWLDSAVNKAQAVTDHTPATQNIMINVPFREKDEARSLGAKWDREQKSWYIPEGVNAALFERWMLPKQENKVQNPEHDQESNIIKSVADRTLGQEVDRLVQEGNLARLGWIEDVLNSMNTLNPDDEFWQRHTDLADTLGITSEAAFEATQYKNFDKHLEGYILAIDDAIATVQDNVHEQEQLKALQQEHQVQKAEAENQQTTKDVSRVYLAVPYEEKDEAKALGAKWDKAGKSWYMDGDNQNLAAAAKWLPENQITQTTPAMSPQEEFADQLRAMGCVVEGGHPYMDGQKHRIETVGDKKGERSGFYVGHLDGHPAGYIKNNRTGEEVRWKSKGYSLSAEEKAKLSAEAAQKLQEREAQRKADQDAAAERIQSNVKNLNALQDGMSTPYLEAKGLSSHPGLFTDKTGEKTYIPVYNVAGELRSMQYIQADGTKRFAKNSEQEGGMHVVGGSHGGHADLANAKVIVLAEGYATAASIHEVTGSDICCVATFNSGNLPIVAKALAEQYPQAQFLIAGDDDLATEAKQGRNPGREKAMEAAQAINCGVVFPTFAPGEQSENNKAFTDFNDLAQKSKFGREGVQKQIREAINRKPEQALSQLNAAIVQTAADQKEKRVQSRSQEERQQQHRRRGNAR